MGLYAPARGCAKPSRLNQSLNNSFESCRFKWCGDVFVAAGSERLFAKLVGAVSRDRYNRHGIECLQIAYPPCCGKAVELRHLHIHDDQVRRLSFGAIYRLESILGFDDTKPSAFQPGAQ